MLFLTFSSMAIFLIESLFFKLFDDLNMSRAAESLHSVMFPFNKINKDRPKIIKT